MKTSQTGIDLIKRWEGFEARAYFDAAGVPTIGYGRTRGVTRQDVLSGREMSLFEAEAYLREDIIDAEVMVLNFTEDLNQNQFDAIVSFVFNLGGQAFIKSTLLKRLKARDYADVPFQLARYNKARDPRTGRLRVLKGLVARRAAEAELFMREDPYEQVVYDNKSVSGVEPQGVRYERESLSQSRTIKGGAVSMAGTVTTAVSGAVSAVEPLTEKTPWLPSVLSGLIVFGLVLAFAGVCVVLYARRDDFLKAIR